MAGSARHAGRLLGTWAWRYRFAFAAFAVALVPRIGYVLHGAGYRGTFRYDPSVYYAASAALLHGRLPYSDYTLLHPPGIVLVLTPFAEVGDLTSDHKGFILASVAFTVLGAVNAGLVVRVLEALGLGARAALCGGLFYAVWIGAVDAEYLIRLEPLGNFLMLCGLLALAKVGASNRAWLVAAAGAAFGAATSVKIWFAVPLIVIMGWQLVVRREGVQAARLAAGAAVSLTAICGVFFAAAPGRMWTMLVSDQLRRQVQHPLIGRLIRMAGVGVFDSSLSLVWQWIVVCLVGVVVLAVCVLAWRAPLGRLIVALLVANVTVIAAAPSYFTFYNDFIALPLALAVGMAVRRRAAATTGSAWRWPTVLGAVLGAAAVVTSAVMCIVLPPNTVLAYPAQELASGVAGARCVQSDSPMPLIELNVLTRALDNNCQLWMDVSGRTFDVDAEQKNGRTAPRAENHAWQQDLTQYLFAGQRAIVFRAHQTGIGPALRARLRAAPVAARSGHFKVLRTNPPPPP